MFWAKARRIPPPIKRAIDALDHFSVQPRRLPRARGAPRGRLPRARHAARPRARTSACTSSAWTPTTRTSSSAPRRSASVFDGPRADARQRRQRRTAARRSGSRCRRARARRPSSRTRARSPRGRSSPSTARSSRAATTTSSTAPRRRTCASATRTSTAGRRSGARTLTSSMLRAIRTFGPEYLVDAPRQRRHQLRRLLRDLPADRRATRRSSSAVEAHDGTARPARSWRSSPRAAAPRRRGRFIRRFGMRRVRRPRDARRARAARSAS